jgi:hypothetical protein
MVHCRKIEAIIKLQWMERFLAHEEINGFFPGRFPLICRIIASGFEWESGLVNESAQLFFYSFGKFLWIGSGFICVIEKLLNGDFRHGQDGR